MDNAVSGQIKLIDQNDSQNNINKSFYVQQSNEKVNLSDVTPGTWDIKVTLFDNSDNEVVSGTGSIDVLPGRNNNAAIELNTNGGLDISVDVNAVPSDPTGLNASLDGNQVDLNWEQNSEDNIKGYAVYRSQSETGVKKCLTNDLINVTNYSDTNVSSGQKYYYWVKAYNQVGYSSGFSQVEAVAIKNSLNEKEQNDTTGNAQKIVETETYTGNTVGINYSYDKDFYKFEAIKKGLKINFTPGSLNDETSDFYIYIYN